MSHWLTKDFEDTLPSSLPSREGKLVGCLPSGEEKSPRPLWERVRVRGDFRVNDGRKKCKELLRTVH
jgi:hypothetical protein